MSIKQYYFDKAKFNSNLYHNQQNNYRVKKYHIYLERIFEKITIGFTSVISNSISFIIALAMVVFWLSNRNYEHDPINDSIRDIMHAVIFLTLFIIQRAFNHFTASLHIKLDELVASHETASNAVINIESKTEAEISELKKEYTELAKQSLCDNENSGSAEPSNTV